ncbi:MAG: hypothetical protein DMG04_05835 [Acidobacteria bacterium]|nr:MAG: hypothetical protein DMG04_05835 [Acidobacteriota bacterium]
MQIGNGMNIQAEVKLPVHRALANRQLDSTGLGSAARSERQRQGASAKENQMRFMLIALTVFVVGLAVGLPGVAATAFAGAQAGQPRSANDVLPGLLAEVHGLRLAMEQSAAVTPRLQLTLARLTIEEQRVTHLTAAGASFWLIVARRR